MVCTSKRAKAKDQQLVGHSSAVVVLDCEGSLCGGKMDIDVERR